MLLIVSSDNTEVDTLIYKSQWLVKLPEKHLATLACYIIACILFLGLALRDFLTQPVIFTSAACI